MINKLLKYFCDFCEIYASTKYLVITIYIFKFVTTMILGSFSGANVILKRFI